jgi:hypothetical protein
MSMNPMGVFSSTREAIDAGAIVAARWRWMVRW